MRILTFVCLVAFICLVTMAAGVLEASGLDRVGRGMRVRGSAQSWGYPVEEQGGEGKPVRFRGHVESLTGDTLVVRAGGATIFAIPVASLRSLEISVGRRSKVWGYARKGLLFGAAVGTLIGAAAPAWAPAPIGSNSERVVIAVWGAAAFGTLGAVGGAAIGVFRRVEAWERVPLDRTASLRRPGARRLGLAWTVAF